MNKREKILVTMLLVVASMYLFNQFLLAPSLQKYDELKAERDGLLMRTKQIEKRAEKIKSKKEETELLESELDKLSISFFESYEIEHIGYVINGIIDKNNINVSSYSPSEVTIKSLTQNESVAVQESSTIEEAYDRMQGRTQASQKAQKKDKEGEGVISAPEFNISMSFKGSYVDIMNFISDIENNEKKFSVNSIQLNSGKGEEGGMSGAITISTFVLPIERKFDEDVFEKEGRKDNPFSRLNNNGVKINLVRKKADMFLLLKPTSSDHSSMMMGMNDSERDTNIKLDSDNVEECVIDIKEEQGKILLRYSIGDVSYPKEGYREIRVNNDDEIILEVVSNKRNSNDENGVGARIINNSPYTFIYRIDGDDKDNPRFIILEQKGSVRGE